MKNLLILVKMQLKEQLNFKRFEVENVKAFHVILGIVGAILKFVMVTGLCWAFLFVSRLLGLFSFAGRPIPDTVISLVFSVMLLMSVISCTVGLTKSLYYARDNAVLLTLPATALHVYLSKLIIFFMFEIKRNFSFLVPLFIAYYFTHGYAITAYVWMLFCMLWVSLFTVAIGAILSIPAMWIANFFRQQKWLQVITLVLAVSGAIALLFYGISLIPANVDLVAMWKTLYWDIQAFLESYAEKFSALYDLTRMLLGEESGLAVGFPIAKTAVRFLVLAAATGVFLGGGLLIVRPLFYKMASTPFEYLKRQVKPKKNRARRPWASSIYTNFLSTVKDTNSIFSNVAITVSVPMLIFLLNKVFLAMKTREMGDHMIIAFNLMIMLLVVLNSNCAMASIFSRDGRSSYLIKTLPSSYVQPIIAKVLPGTTFGVVSIAATGVILYLTLPLAISQIVMIVVAVELIYLAHMLYSAEQDLMNPQNQLYASVGSSESNPNETKSTLYAFLISFVVAVAVFALLLEGRGKVFEKLLAVAIGAFIYRTYLFFSMLKLYYKEK